MEEQKDPNKSGFNLDGIKDMIAGFGKETSKKHISNYTLEERKAWKKKKKKAKSARKTASKSRKINRRK